jgi:Lrp/AsnC family leucine-responsive transcriptional regulator
VDRIDIDILSCLKENARMSISTIAERINMSVSAVGERIKKLENAGIIKQYTVILDAKRIGKELFAFISVSLEHPKYNELFIESIKNNTQITECHYVTGDFDFLLKVVTKSTDTLSNILNIIKSIRGVSLTRTLVVLSTPKNELSYLPDISNRTVDPE